jgi:hypothetical protein
MNTDSNSYPLVECRVTSLNIRGYKMSRASVKCRETKDRKSSGNRAEMYKSVHETWI